MIITVDGDVPSDHFTIVPNEIMRDGNLSLKAKGLLAYLLGHKPGYSLSVEQLAADTADGQYAIKAAIAELESHGLLTRERTRDERGRLAEVSYIVTIGGFSTSGFPTSGGTHIKEYYREEDYSVSTTQPLLNPKSIERDADFDEFWVAYPLKVGKRDAEKKWKSARRRAKPAAILAGLNAAKLAWGDDKRYIPHPATWLNQDRWADEDHLRRGGPSIHADRAEVDRLLEDESGR